ncbi:carbohydrate-binding module family 20 domain-containing protein [Nocardiopsis sp. NPDC050513]|uniref:carbohydrate-binding module family 20 domain-containing protein n=1 Tax=Nocardiopsis sp. NPDC050513 TaxID=3364338 RepID=UPI0037A70613
MSSTRHRFGGAASALLLGATLAAPVLAATPAAASAAPAAQPPTAVPREAPAAAVANGETVVHLFQWTWDSVAAECEDFLGPQGFGGVQVSPPQEHVVVPSAEGGEYPWWQDYQPVSYRIDNTRRGTAAEFQAMVDTCRDNGVRIYVDAVINHMTGPGSGTGSAGTEWEYYAYPDLFGDGSAAYDRADFGPCYEPVSDWNDKWEVQNCQLLGLSDLNTADPQVRERIRRYLNGLVDMGVAGFRVDAAKHVPEAHVQDIFADLNDVPGFGGQPDVYQEVIGDATIPYTQYTPSGRVTNFDYQRDIAARFADGAISGLANLPDYGGLADDQATVFIDNHDTQRSAPTLTHKDGDRYYLATAFMLAHPYGQPKVMSSYEFHEEAQGPPSVGEVDGNPAGWITEDTDCSSAAWVCEHRNPTVAGMAAFRNATGDTAVVQRATDGDSRLAFDRGSRGFAAFNASGATWNLTTDTALPDGVYENAAGDGAFTVSGGRVAVTVPANGAVALHVGGVCDDPAECGGDDCTTVAAEFHVQAETYLGQEVYLVGSLPELGSWDPANGVRLSTDEGSYPWWTGSTGLPVGTEFEYKYVKTDGAGNVEWEVGGNRVATGDDSGGGCTQVFTEYWR